VIAARSRRALVVVVLLIALATAFAAAPAGARNRGGERVDPFCAGVTDTWVEACVGSLYDTVAALTGMVGMGMPL
jgi:hypothetical protein